MPLQPLNKAFMMETISPAGPPRPKTQTMARAITESLRYKAPPAPMYPYPEINQSDAMYDTPGKGVSGETSN